MRLSIRNLLLGWGLLSAVTAIALAGVGFAGAVDLTGALKRVVLVDQALRNHNDADTFMDDSRADVLRAIQQASGVNQEGKDFIRGELRHHQDVITAAIIGNLALRLPPRIHEAYQAISGLVLPFLEASQTAVELALEDPALGAANFEQFRGKFTALEDAMDSTREQLRAIVRQAGIDSERTAERVRDRLMAATALGLLLLSGVSAAAIRTAQRMTNDLSNSRAQAEHLAFHDSLTGLPNRTLLAQQMRSACSAAQRSGRPVATLCLDLDRFKHVNDTLGHQAGDELLRAVAERLRASIRNEDTVARLGGDEFAIIQVGLEQPESAGALAQRLIEVLTKPYDILGHQVVVGTSIGIAVTPDDGNDEEELLKKSDTALYRAKSDGRGTFRFFEREMDARLQSRRLLELDLRKALAANEFELYYQPTVALETSTVVAFEALLRWNHPQRGMIAPTEFIGIAEEIGLIVQIGEWVLMRACTEAALWPKPARVAVNLSAVQFRGDGLVRTVSNALASSGLPPWRLELEITETVLLQHSEATLAILTELRQLGVQVAMDDFGTGYSSLGYLRSFPFDRIKIDRCFVKDLETSADCEAIVRAVTSLGGSLGIATTAEGVETAEQFARVRAEGCGEVQGYFVSPPVPATAVPGILLTGDPANHDRVPALLA
jgi:diguanylate cyclase (GGDEF)-like protein